MDAATIKIFLVHGSPKGLRTAELSNWSGKAVAAPRNELAALLKRAELSNPGVYFLSGVDSDSGDNAIYIGEAENVANRLKSHSATDYWNAVTVFVSKDENLTKSHIRYLEGKLIRHAAETSTSKLMNSANSGSKLPESDEAEMDIFLQKMLQLLPVLGVMDFGTSIEGQSREEDILYCKIKGLTASGKRSSGGFTVFAGSQAVLEHRPSATRMRKKREHLVEKGLLKADGQHLVFTRDVEFGSPSTAAAMVRGGSSNGLKAWKSAGGVSLKVIEASET